jgi:predicted permease
VTILDELRHAVRSLSRSKGFTATASLTLALALGLATPIFGMLDQMLHPYTPIQDPEQVVVIQGVAGPRTVTAYDRYVMIREGTRFARAMVPVVRSSAMIEVPERRSQTNVQAVPPAYFDLLGVKPLFGRAFDLSRRDDAAIVLGVEMWRRMFPGRAGVTGASVTVDGRTYDVIGVMPERTGDAFVVTDPNRAPSPPNRWVTVTARLKPGVTPEGLAHELGIIAHRITVEHGDPRRPARFEVAPAVPPAENGGGGGGLFVGTALAILIIACANLANLMLVRGTSRRREIALKLALGASRATVVRQLVLEALVISAIGATLGVPLSLWGISVLRHEVPTWSGAYSHFGPHVNWHTFAFILLTALTIGVVVGVFPGMRASEVQLNEPLKESASGLTPRARRRHAMLAVVELSLALPLLMDAGIFLRALVRVSGYDFGFDASKLLMGELYLTGLPGDQTRGRELFAHALATAGKVSGVERVAMLGFPGGSTPVAPDIPLPPQRLAVTQVANASAGFETIIGVPVVAGRGFQPGDVGEPVALVDETAARELWGNGISPIGHTLKLGPENAPTAWVRVIGVIRDASIGFRPFGPHRATVFLPPDAAKEGRVLLAVRTKDFSGRVASDLERQLQTGLGLHYPPRFAPWRAASGLASAIAAIGVLGGTLSVFGAAALGLAAVGLYGVLTFAVNQRRREFAIRMALGASERSVFRSVVRDGFAIVLAGTGVGAFVALTSAQVLGLSSDGLIQATDAVALVGAELVLCIVAFLACLAPARQAMTADPAEILRAV